MYLPHNLLFERPFFQFQNACNIKIDMIGLIVLTLIVLIGHSSRLAPMV